jgi:hypothetical protein
MGAASADHPHFRLGFRPALGWPFAAFATKLVQRTSDWTFSAVLPGSAAPRQPGW